MTKDEIAVMKVMHQLVAMAVCSPPHSRMGEWSVQCLRFLEEGDALRWLGEEGIAKLKACDVRTDYSNN